MRLEHVSGNVRVEHGVGAAELRRVQFGEIGGKSVEGVVEVVVYERRNVLELRVGVALAGRVGLVGEARDDVTVFVEVAACVCVGGNGDDGQERIVLVAVHLD